MTIAYIPNRFRDRDRFLSTFYNEFDKIVKIVDPDFKKECKEQVLRSFFAEQVKTVDCEYDTRFGGYDIYTYTDGHINGTLGLFTDYLELKDPFKYDEEFSELSFTEEIQDKGPYTLYINFKKRLEEEIEKIEKIENDEELVKAFDNYARALAWIESAKIRADYALNAKTDSMGIDNKQLEELYRIKKQIEAGSLAMKNLLSDIKKKFEEQAAQLFKENEIKRVKRLLNL